MVITGVHSIQRRKWHTSHMDEKHDVWFGLATDIVRAMVVFQITHPHIIYMHELSSET
jgi:hypothetical protein